MTSLTFWKDINYIIEIYYSTHFVKSILHLYQISINIFAFSESFDTWFMKRLKTMQYDIIMTSVSAIAVLLSR